MTLGMVLVLIAGLVLVGLILAADEVSRRRHYTATIRKFDEHDKRMRQIIDAHR